VRLDAAQENGRRNSAGRLRLRPMLWFGLRSFAERFRGSIFAQRSASLIPHGSRNARACGKTRSSGAQAGTGVSNAKAAGIGSGLSVAGKAEPGDRESGAIAAVAVATNGIRSDVARGNTGDA
jgi:hypothetical protein